MNSLLCRDHYNCGHNGVDRPESDKCKYKCQIKNMFIKIKVSHSKSDSVEKI